MVLCRVLVLGLIALTLLVPVVRAQDCEPDEIIATSMADTIFVDHLRAERNCCTDLTIEVEADGFVVDFFEGNAGDWCLCLCCFNLNYSAHGFAAGHYVVRVWNEDGSELFGETEVDVEGNGEIPTVATFERGRYNELDAVEETNDNQIYWG